MGQDIFAGVLCLIVIAAGVWGWWIDRGIAPDKKDAADPEKDHGNKEKER